MDSTSFTEKSQSRHGELFLVATPIGNLRDITLRALEVLQSVDRIACEDTRTSGVLLKHYGIQTAMTSYHTHNETQASGQLAAQLLAGERIALICDAGTPLLSDPGALLVRAAIAAGIRVTPIPGASALLAALCIAGLPTETFYYAGFLPNKTTPRRTVVAALAAVPASLVFYEAPHRLLDSLTDLAALLGNRAAAVGRELTKMHEECVRGSLTEIIDHFTQHAPRGESVVIVQGAAPAAAMNDAQVDSALKREMATLSLKEAVASVAEHSGRARSDIYTRALALKDEA